MGEVYDLKQHGTPTLSEWKKFAISVLILGFIIGFNDKSSTGIGLSYFKNMLLSIFFVSISIIISNFVTRLHTALIGYKSEYSFSINGLLIGLMLAFVSNGYFWYLSPGYQIIHLNETGRLGHFRYGLRMKDWARVAFSASFTHIFLALIVYLIAHGNPAMDLFIKINIALGLYSFLPIPENNGINLFYGQRSLFYFSICSIIAILVSMFFLQNILLILFFAFIIGIVGIVYGIRFDRS